MALVVQKFGGTSVADADRMREVADHVKRTRSRGDQVVLVVSAMGKETDELLRLADEVNGEPPGREMDMLITAGERKSIALMCMALHAAGVPADSFTGSQAGFETDNNHRNAKILSVDPHRVRDSVDKDRVAVVAGAQGMSGENNVTFLGRGGSDTTAVALAHGLGADACELYTDVSGVFTTDPRVCPGAKRMESISFDELLEMTAVGCPKPVMRSVEVARAFGVPLHVRSAFTWEPGTWVVEEDPDMERAIIKGIVPDTSQAKVTLSGVQDQPGLAAKVFRTLAEASVNVDMIVQNVSENGRTDISFTVPLDDLEVATSTCETLAETLNFAGVMADPDLGRVSVVGAGMASNPGVAATMFETLAEIDVNIEMIATSPIRISCVVSEADVDRATVALHAAYGLD
ncbi:MAG: aspartate kinase [Acidimicrobiaceae bacterium]|nr:aspartate kinase [Acidimicrobiaceae bacterium]MAP97317.1 aspartate kinase [Acidimicrobiaceae bacterium]MCH2632286.1 aspartate kinase [Acidimicrobiales bacterium]HBV24919.1 aspartate kinase [Acidimicrobiaceae bacterium]HCK73357.1 aspartate kinase [Acidimicrobiaceae bacterium]